MSCGEQDTGLDVGILKQTMHPMLRSENIENGNGGSERPDSRLGTRGNGPANGSWNTFRCHSAVHANEYPRIGLRARRDSNPRPLSPQRQRSIR